MPLLVLDRRRALAIATKYGAPSIFNAGPAGLLRDALRLHLAGQQQRLGVRRLHRASSSPTRPATSAPSASPSPTCSAALAMLLGALRAAAARARRRRLAGRASGSRPPGPGTMRTDTPTFVVLLIGDDPARRAAHLRPRPAARPDRPGPHRPALLTMRKDLDHLRASPSSCFTRRSSGSPIRSLITGVAPGRLPGQGRRQPDRARRQGRRLAADRPGLPRPCSARRQAERRDGNRPRADPRYFQSRPSATGYNAAGTAFTNLGPNSKDAARPDRRRTSTAYLALERPLQPRPDGARGVPVDAVPDVRLGRRPAHLARPTPRSRRAASPRARRRRSTASAR